MKTQYDPVQIVATLGPATTDPAVLEALLRAGTQIVRLCSSWGTQQEHSAFVDATRQAAGRVGRRVAIMQDLDGPRVANSHTYDPTASVITEKDIVDLKAMLAREVDYVVQSLVRTAADVEDLRSILAAEGHARKIVAKIERPEALQNLDEIIATADGIMVVHGDLEAVSAETVPFVKKDILERCRRAHVPCIGAPGLVNVMQDDAAPAQTDISNIAQSVLDGASAIMLSHETAADANPVETVALVRRVVDEALTHTKTGSLVRFRV